MVFFGSRKNLNRIKELEEKIESLEKELEKAKNPIGDATSIELAFSGDLTAVTPIVRYRPDDAEKLVDLDMLSPKSMDDRFAVQLAIVAMAESALGHMLDEFGEEPMEVKHE